MPLEVEHEVKIAVAVTASTRIKIVFLIFVVFKLNNNCLVERGYYQVIQRKGCGIKMSNSKDRDRLTE